MTAKYLALLFASLPLATPVLAQTTESVKVAPNIRYVHYDPNSVVRLTGHTGYQMTLAPADLSEMLPVLLGMLGLGGLRTIEKLKEFAAQMNPVPKAAKAPKKESVGDYHDVSQDLESSEIPF